MNIDTYGQECPFVQVYKKPPSGGTVIFISPIRQVLCEFLCLYVPPMW
jgi:hypothetical protein